MKPPRSRNAAGRPRPRRAGDRGLPARLSPDDQCTTFTGGGDQKKASADSPMTCRGTGVLPSTPGLTATFVGGTYFVPHLDSGTSLYWSWSACTIRYSPGPVAYVRPPITARLVGMRSSVNSAGRLPIQAGPTIAKLP